MWRRYYSNKPEDKRPKTFIDALNFCESTLHESIHRFLQIGATLLVSVASSERSFSCLRSLKTYLRNKTVEDRLNGLVLFNIYRDLEVSCGDILDIMTKTPRRINLIL
ncbi:uncharacterized protein LOC103308298 [Acyrthosiphon pisum]|uniref:HAT C-terminal dimerisation domain-containing protein n=1 Tax=Acyrthosiphon pisum TaxID=7029 RepID=A0A8R1WYJ8_ACYPI|nr:uncharacterized protein LOC103308298 [Acyrthosiphon pisum]|eukprot:XP_008179664.1 PREDICTED: uncharacterized protein LOC103308298 [Acyrthosiphon pisum]